MIIVAMIFFWLLYHGINIFLGWQNKQTVQKRLNHKDLRQIEHFEWGVMYAALCIPWYWVYGPWFVASLVPLHLGVFGYAYNSYRGLAPFNLSKTTTSTLDKTLVKLKFKSSEFPYFLSELVAFALLTISIFKNR